MNRLITKTPPADNNTNLTFPSMGQKPGAKTVTIVKPSPKAAKKPKKAASKPNPFAAKAATALVSNFSAKPVITAVKGK